MLGGDVAKSHVLSVHVPKFTVLVPACFNVWCVFGCAGARPKRDTTPLEERPMQLELSQQQLLGVMDHLLCLF
jgi:hypothetical protein